MVLSGCVHGVYLITREERNGTEKDHYHSALYLFRAMQDTKPAGKWMSRSSLQFFKLGLKLGIMFLTHTSHIFMLTII